MTFLHILHVPHCSFNVSGEIYNRMLWSGWYIEEESEESNTVGVHVKWKSFLYILFTVSTTCCCILGETKKFKYQKQEVKKCGGCTTQQTRRLFFHYMTDNDQWMLQHYCNLQSLRLDTTTSCTHLWLIKQIAEYCWVHLEGVSCLSVTCVRVNLA